MKISIVEDEAVWREQIQSMIEKYGREQNISFQISAYEKGRDFMGSADADLLFLDIELAARKKSSASVISSRCLLSMYLNAFTR